MIKKHIDYDIRAISKKWFSESIVVGLAAFLLALLTWRTFEVEVMPLVKPRIEIQVENIPQTQQMTAAPPPERPAVPIESEDEDLPDDVTITSTTIDFNEEPPPPPPPEEEEVPEFVAYDKAPQVVKRVEPKYPEIARKAGIEGVVWLKFVVDTSGNVRPSNIKVVKNTTGNSGCVEAAIEAVKKWKFSPAYQRDKPVKVWVTIPFKFYLKNK